MTDLQLYSEIISLPSDLKQEASDFIAFLKYKSKMDNKPPKSVYIAEESLPIYKSKFSDILLNGPVFSDEQIHTIEETRKSINEWRAK